MRAFHNNPAIKDKYLARVKAHRLADNLIQGTGWDGEKGCAVGCTLEDYNHKAYEDELGIPEWLARVEDTIFEGLPNDKAMEWPERFLSAIKPGTDLDKIKAPFMICVLQSTFDTFDHIQYPGVKQSLDNVISLYQSKETDRKKFREAAWAAAVRAVGATGAALEAAAAASEAAWAAAVRAVGATGAALEAAAAARAAGISKSERYEQFANKLIELLEVAVNDT